MPELSRVPLVALAVVWAGCEGNTALPDRPAYLDDEESGACVPYLDGEIGFDKLRVGLDVPLTFRVSPAGELRSVAVEGDRDADGLRWDWSEDHESDRRVEVMAVDPGLGWYADRFVDATFAMPFDAAGTVQSISRRDEQGIWLLGFASTQPNPPQGRTLIVYDPPVQTLRFPISPSDVPLTTQTVIRDALAGGIPYAATVTYRIEVDAVGELELPAFTVSEAHRVRTTVDTVPAVGESFTTQRVSLFTECLGEVARADLAPPQEGSDGAAVLELRRLGL